MLFHSTYHFRDHMLSFSSVYLVLDDVSHCKERKKRTSTAISGLVYIIIIITTIIIIIIIIIIIGHFRAPFL